MKFSEITTLEEYKEHLRQNTKAWYEKNKEYKKAKQREYYRTVVKPRKEAEKAAKLTASK